MNQTEQQTLLRKAKSAEISNKRLFQKLRQKMPKNLDETVKELHHKAFEQISCTTCANCCKTTSPRFLDKDIERLARYFKSSPGQFITRYLKIDKDGDYVLQHAPCPFLADDNLCMVYNQRPNACREYPHTDQRKFHVNFDITLKNTFVCPAVFEIIEQLKLIYPDKSAINKKHPA